jgi:sugar/nucleoside kinase (ribokinase family)
MSVVVVGDAVTDIHAVHSGPIEVGSDTPASIRVSGGGSAANTAAWLATTGTAVQLVAVVGRDAAGDDVIAELTAAGVDCVHVRRSGDAPTGSVIVLTHAGERSFVTDRGANLLLVPSDVDSVLRPGVRHLHLSGYTLLDASSRSAGRHALTAARAHGCTTSVDVASTAPLRRAGPSTVLEWVRGTDILFANLEEARVLSDGESPVHIAHALTRYAGAVVVKLGADGAVWASGGDVVTAAAVSACVIDPTGAGDAFAAGVLASWLGGCSPEECLAAGARLGAAAVSVAGGRPPRP